jgi:hypothetical protein
VIVKPREVDSDMTADHRVWFQLVSSHTYRLHRESEMKSAVAMTTVKLSMTTIEQRLRAASEGAI